MNNRSNIIWLVKFELRHSVYHLLLLIPLVFIFLFVIHSLVPAYLEVATMGLDFFLFFTVLTMSQITRPKDFQIQKINGKYYAAPFLILLNQLSIPRNVIVKYRFLSYVIIYTIFFILLFLGLYPAFNNELTIPSYFVFTIIWYCIGIYLGCATPRYEAISNMGRNIVIAHVSAPFVFFGYIFLFYKWFNLGLIGWTIYIASEYKIISVFISLLFTWIGWIYWQKRMKQKMSQADYY